MTNVYADLSAPLIKEEGPLHIPYRLAEPYENLRAYFEKDQPKVVLLTFGELKDFKPRADFVKGYLATGGIDVRSEEHTSELQSRGHLVCRLLLEKKKK